LIIQHKGTKNISPQTSKQEIHDGAAE